MDSTGNTSVVHQLARDLLGAIELMLNSDTCQSRRLEAYIHCEKFKEQSPLCAQVGLYLASSPFDPTIRHIGLQFMEHTIKFKWNEITQEEKIFIKENSMKLLDIGVGAVEDTSLSHIKDALARVIVEMVKREWPQQWSTLLSELSDACGKGEAQTELVLLIFLRLVEDVAVLQTIESNQRRKDIYQALTNNMNEIFGFFLRLIELHVNAFRSTTAMGNGQKAQAHSRVVQVVLLTLTGFTEWVSITHIMSGDGRLLQILCILMNDIEFQIPAAECLSQIANRRGQLKDRKPLAILFSNEAIRYICAAGVPVNGATSNQHYRFIKIYVQVLMGMATLIPALLLTGAKDEQQIMMIEPTHMKIYLNLIYTLTGHVSPMVTHSVCLIWLVLIKCDQLAKDPIFLEYIPKIIQTIGPKVIKFSYPVDRKMNVALNVETFIGIDFDSEEEYTIFLNRYRTDILEIFRHATLLAPLVTFGFCEHWLRMRLQKATTERNIGCTVKDPIYLEWEALSVVLDSVLSRILHVTERPAVSIGLRLLEDCLCVQTTNPLILSILLSCISALFVFLSMSSCQITSGNCIAMTGVSLLPRVLEKIFATLMFSDSVNVEAVKNLRRHAASLMVKLGIKYPLLLLPVFDEINTTVRNLLPQLNKMENVTLQEALLIISNQFCDYERQTNFVRDSMLEIQTQWLTFSSMFKCANDFIRFLGIDRPIVGQHELDVSYANRSSLLHALNMVLGVIKRCGWPDDPDRASRGGFIIGFTESGNPIFRNPASPHVIPLLPHILQLLRILNEIYLPNSMGQINESFKNVLSMIDNEKKNLMGMPAILIDPMDPTQNKETTIESKLQNYITLLFENCYHMMGSAGPSLGRDLYQIPGIANGLINSVFSNVKTLPDFRLRSIIRVFLKPFVYSCPPVFYDSVIIPIFSHVASFMLERLTIRWQSITSFLQAGKFDEDVDDTQEVFEDMLNRTLTREYLDVLKVALVGGTLNERICQNGSAVGGGAGGGGGSGIGGGNDNGSSTANMMPPGGVESMMDHDDHSMDSTPYGGMSRATQSAMAAEVISDLGAKLLKCEQTCLAIVFCIVKALAWNDGVVSLKAVYLTGPIIKFLAAEKLITTSIASNILISLLQGLQVHGQHDSNQSTLITLGVQVYEILRPNFPHIMEIIAQIPNINVADVQKLDEKIISGLSTKGNKIDKAKKDLFKKITAQLVGKNIGQLFRAEIKMTELPPIMRNSPQYKNNVIDSCDNTIDISKMFSPSSS